MSHQTFHHSQTVLTVHHVTESQPLWQLFSSQPNPATTAMIPIPISLYQLYKNTTKLHSQWRLQQVVSEHPDLPNIVNDLLNKLI